MTRRQLLTLGALAPLAPRALAAAPVAPLLPWRIVMLRSGGLLLPLASVDMHAFLTRRAHLDSDGRCRMWDWHAREWVTVESTKARPDLWHPWEAQP